MMSHIAHTHMSQISQHTSCEYDFCVIVIKLRSNEDFRREDFPSTDTALLSAHCSVPLRHHQVTLLLRVSDPIFHGIEELRLER